ncbi:hypothetical protein [Paraburkholderia sp. BL27I4N3]|uniref:hypothetical protein n=1 Tax=Paraburkholderia sp. BL27I4N3 TaxID=1938805 RepID=UPI000E238C4D|nr:hypothetical protein [Paraburkholderia sp. BL27I4N3]
MVPKRMGDEGSVLILLRGLNTPLQALSGKASSEFDSLDTSKNTTERDITATVGEWQRKSDHATHAKCIAAFLARNPPETRSVFPSAQEHKNQSTFNNIRGFWLTVDRRTSKTTLAYCRSPDAYLRGRTFRATRLDPDVAIDRVPSYPLTRGAARDQ